MSLVQHFLQLLYSCWASSADLTQPLHLYRTYLFPQLDSIIIFFFFLQGGCFVCCGEMFVFIWRSELLSRGRPAGLWLERSMIMAKVSRVVTLYYSVFWVFFWRVLLKVHHGKRLFFWRGAKTWGYNIWFSFIHTTLHLHLFSTQTKLLHIGNTNIIKLKWSCLYNVLGAIWMVHMFDYNPFGPSILLIVVNSSLCFLEIKLFGCLWKSGSNCFNSPQENM